jgi:hypothetical protein
MLSTVIINNVTASDAIGFKYQLETDGLVRDRDFVWHYSPVKYEDWFGSPKQESWVKFDFSNPSLASFYCVKWTR